MSALKLYEHRRAFEQRALSKCIASLDAVEADPVYKDENNPTRGKCYYASVALLVYLGGSKAGYHLLKADDILGAHYWVENSERTRFDPTVDQFRIMGRLPPYSNGKRVSYRPNFTKHLPVLKAMQLIPEDVE